MRNDNNRGFSLLNAILANLILAIGFFAFIAMIVWAGKVMVSGTNLLFDIHRASSNIPRSCASTEQDCGGIVGSPAICIHDQENGKTVQACEDDCLFISGSWHKGSQVCNKGVLFFR